MIIGPCDDVDDGDDLNRSLTKVLLKKDFRLDWTIPINHLCPPLPQRLNYIHWIAELLGVPWPPPKTSSIVGLDM